MIIGLFALAGLLPFTVLTIQSTRTTARRFQDATLGVAGMAVSTLFIASLAGIDTGFAVLLVRSVMLALHPPAIS